MKLVAQNALEIDWKAKVVAAVKVLVWIAAAEKYEPFAARMVGLTAAYKTGMAEEASLVVQMTTMAD